MFASAHRSPHLSGVKEADWTHKLGDVEFVEVVKRFDFIPEEALGNSELLKLVLPAFKADMCLHETYVYGSSKDKVLCPVVGFAGDSDYVTPADMHAWKDVTVASFETQVFEGGHFYTSSKESKGPFLESLVV